jgi:hypothetical protein
MASDPRLTPESDGPGALALVIGLGGILLIVLLVALAAQGAVFALVLALAGMAAGLLGSYWLIGQLTRRRGPYRAEEERDADQR